MKFEYIGDAQPVVTTLGYTFPTGEAVEVTDEKAIAKLKGNTFFRAIDGDEGEQGDGEKPKRGRRAKADQPDEGEQGE